MTCRPIACVALNLTRIWLIISCIAEWAETIRQPMRWAETPKQMTHPPPRRVHCVLCLDSCRHEVPDEIVPYPDVPDEAVGGGIQDRSGDRQHPRCRRFPRYLRLPCVQRPPRGTPPEKTPRKADPWEICIVCRRLVIVISTVPPAHGVCSVVPLVQPTSQLARDGLQTTVNGIRLRAQACSNPPPNYIVTLFGLLSSLWVLDALWNASWEGFSTAPSPSRRAKRY